MALLDVEALQMEDSGINTIRNLKTADNTHIIRWLNSVSETERAKTHHVTKDFREYDALYDNEI